MGSLPGDPWRWLGGRSLSASAPLAGWRIRGALLIAATAVMITAASAQKDSRAPLGPNSSRAMGDSVPLPTTLDDFFQAGTQPLGDGVPSDFAPMVGSLDCYFCHSNYGSMEPFEMVEPFNTWAASMMAQSARDPLFHAALTIANQTVPDSGVFCIRCHAPTAFLRGHAVPTDLSSFELVDFEGVSCNFCHRMVDPVFKPDISPAEDEQILWELTKANLMPPQSTNARYVVDPTDSRRGPRSDVPLNIHTGNPMPEIIASPFHSTAEFCWTCHDVSNPLMMKQANGSYALAPLGQPHPTGNQSDMLPVHRTYSEWINSYYSTIGVQHNGRFGGNHATGLMKDCQDCHMPDTFGYACSMDFDPFFPRQDVAQHSFMGANYWVVNAIRTVDFDGDGEPDFPDNHTYLSDPIVAAQVERTMEFLRRASDVELLVINDQLRVRLINHTGHKLPTGFPDGRRIWLNVKYFDCQENLIHEHGAYDFEEATLSTEDTKVYEIHLGIEGADYAQMIGLPEGHTFHFMLANTILKDNRIPPAGFSNLAAIQNQTQSVGATYVNGQNWDDTHFPLPAGASQVVVTAYYQLTSREFIEYLRDANITDNKGQVVYDLWVEHGRSTPVAIDMASLPLFRPGDVNKDGVVNVNDLLIVINAWGACPATPAPCPADVVRDGVVNVNDLLAVINSWGGCQP